MASKNKFYTVLMRRWGDLDSHAYILGVFNSKHKALESGKAEWECRGCGKYEPELTEWDLNAKSHGKNIDNGLSLKKMMPVNKTKQGE